MGTLGPVLSPAGQGRGPKVFKTKVRLSFWQNWDEDAGTGRIGKNQGGALPSFGPARHPCSGYKQAATATWHPAPGATAIARARAPFAREQRTARSEKRPSHPQLQTGERGEGAAEGGRC